MSAWQSASVSIVFMYFLSETPSSDQRAGDHKSGPQLISMVLGTALDATRASRSPFFLPTHTGPTLMEYDTFIDTGTPRGKCGVISS